MMKSISNLIYLISVIVVGTANVFSTSQAATISYQGTIAPPFSSGIGSGSAGGYSWIEENGTSGFWSTVTGTVGARGWIEEKAEELDFWSFAVGPGGVSLDIWAARGNKHLDTVFSIYSGITTADESKFKRTRDFGGITFYRFADDETPKAGPYGDPDIHNMAFEEGIYTIASGGYYSNAEGPFSYQLSIGASGLELTPVPIPGALLFFVTGLLGFVTVKRCKQ